MKMRRKKGYFSISAVAKMFSVHQQTIRLYEKQGLISPERSSGNTRLFSEEDIDRLEEVVYLTHELGINLAGVEMILKLKKQISRLQKDMNKAFEDTQQELDRDIEHSKAAVQSNAQRLLRIRESRSIPLEPDAGQQSPAIDPFSMQSNEMSNWEIEYDE